jgi:hypothetical protein
MNRYWAELARDGRASFRTLAAATGSTNLVASVGCHDVDALYDYIATRLGTLDAISRIETAPVIHSA